MRGRDLRLLAFAAAVASVVAGPARADDCGKGAEGFSEWLTSFRQVARLDGVSAEAVDAALGGVAYDSSVKAHDHGVASFGHNFAGFAASHVTPGMISRGKAMLRTYAGPLATIEQRFGVPGPVLVAIWGLETSFGGDNGNYPTYSALATLAWDCRRPDRFRAELIAALMMVDRGVVQHPRQLRGAWAGEIGQTQLMPSAVPDVRHHARRRREAPISSTIPPTRSPRPPISSKGTAGRAARAGAKASRTSPPSCNGTPPRSTPGRWRCLPTGLRGGRRKRKRAAGFGGSAARPRGSAMSQDPNAIVALTAAETGRLVETRAACPFIGSAVAEGKLGVRNSAEDPLASIEEVRKLGNSGGGDLGEVQTRTYITEYVVRPDRECSDDPRIECNPPLDHKPVHQIKSFEL